MYFRIRGSHQLATMKFLFLFVVPFFAQVKCQQARLTAVAEGNISAAFNLYQTRASDIANELNTQVNAVKILKSGISELISTYGKELALDYFYQSFTKVFYASEKILEVSSDSTYLSLTTNAVIDQQRYASDYLAQCVKNELKLESDLTQLISTAPQKITAAGQEVTKFKNIVDNYCRSKYIVQREKTKECIDSAMTRVPLPEITSVGQQTVGYLSKLYSCLQTVAKYVQVVGQGALINLRELAPEDLYYLIDEEFKDNFNPPIVFPNASSFVVPNEITVKLSESKSWIQAVKKAVKEAAAFKAMTLVDTINSVKPQIESLTNFTVETKQKSTPAELPCFVPTESFIHNGPKTAGDSLFKCLSTTGQLPSDATIAALENSLKDRELEEKSMIPLIKCAVLPQNAFNPEELSKCFQAGQNAYSSFLDAVKIQADLLNTDATDVLVKAKRCVCKTYTDIKKAAREELYTLTECITKTTKVRFTAPEQSCIINVCN